jgi:hypothetical protein
MEGIDVHDLPEEEARSIAHIVELLQRCRCLPAHHQKTLSRMKVPLASWSLDVKGTRSCKEGNDGLRAATSLT